MPPIHTPNPTKNPLNPILLTLILALSCISLTFCQDLQLQNLDDDLQSRGGAGSGSGELEFIDSEGSGSGTEGAGMEGVSGSDVDGNQVEEFEDELFGDDQQDDGEGDDDEDTYYGEFDQGGDSKEVQQDDEDDDLSVKPENTDFSFYECQTNSDCQTGQQCQNGRCTIQVARARYCRKACGKGFRCKNGQCVPADRCAGVSCQEGFSCKFGKCKRDKKACASNNQCSQDQKCKNGRCKNVCKTKRCRGGTFCLHGDCISEPEGNCQNFGSCPQGTFCKNGKCAPNVLFCPKNSKISYSLCTSPRPTQADCPNTWPPTPKFCGVTKTGQRLNFPSSCQACKQPSIVYYLQKPCHKAPFGCTENESCLGYYCSKKGCSSDRQCPYNWQKCSKGKCVDRCQGMKCSGCKFGQCQFEEPKGQCQLEGGSGSNGGCRKDWWACLGGVCVDSCLRIPCPDGMRCRDGLCGAD